MLNERVLFAVAIWGVSIFLATATFATIFPTVFEGALLTLNTVVSFLLFGIGVLTFIYALVIAANRSRHELLDIAGIFWLTSAPKRTAWRYRSLLLIIICLAFATGGIRLYTAVAFGLLTPMFVLGIMGVWGAKWGEYKKR